MYEERPMPPEPEDDLERMFAAQEAEITDDGFSQRVVEQAKQAKPWRSAILLAAGFTGFGFAVGGIVEAASQLPADWFPDFSAGMAAARLGEAVQQASDPTQLAIVAVVAGISFLVAAMAIQAR
jgi:hypothetical protein